MGVNLQVVEMLSEIASQRRLDKKFVVESVRESFLKAIDRYFGGKGEFEVEISEASGEVKIYRRMKVVKEVKDETTEITLEEAKAHSATAEIGGEVLVEIPLESLGRGFIRMVKQNLLQRMKEAEKDIVYEEYREKIGRTEMGHVARVDRKGVYVHLDRAAEGFMPREEQIPSEFYRQGMQIKALIIDVERKPKGPVVYLSRTHPDFLRRLLEFEIPEIREGIVEIKGVVRDPGKRAKVAVYSKDPKIDPVGACVGMRGSRIQAIVRELNGEKIDIIAWSENPEVFIARALAPAKVLRVIIVDRENKEARCLVQDEQLSLAIGKEGQNVTLAARLTGWKIDVKAQSAYHKEVEEEKRSKLTVDQLPVSDRIKKILREAGYPTAKEIMAASKEELMKLPGLGDKTVDKIYRAIYELLNVGG